MLKNVTKTEVLGRIRFENPWWLHDQIDSRFKSMPHRSYVRQFYKLATNLELQRSIVLMGARRVGKTVLLHQFVQNLLDEGFSAQRILFITIENPIYNNLSLEKLFKYGIEATGAQNQTDHWYVIFDEIQYLKNWDVHLKSIMESYSNIRFIVSGSATAALKFKSNESGAGRFTDFMLPPLTFYEFIQMQQLADRLSLKKQSTDHFSEQFYTTNNIQELNRHFLHYINYGGFPEAIFSDTVRNDPQQFIRHDIIDKVLLRDLPSLYGIADVQELYSLFTTIAYNTANEFSLDTLSKKSGISKNTIKKDLQYLEAAFLIKIVRRVDQSAKRFQRENAFKIYLANPSIRTALFAPLEATDTDMGGLVETAIYAQWFHRLDFTPHYARWHNGEVDLVSISKKNLQPNWALEIKWSDRYAENPASLKSLLKFCKEHKLAKAYVTTLKWQGVKTHDTVEFCFVPSALYAYTAGSNTLDDTNLYL